MRRPPAAWLSGLVLLFVAAPLIRAADAPTSDLAAEVLRGLPGAGGLPAALNKVEPLRAGDLNDLLLRRSLSRLEAVRVDAVLEARVGGATLTTMTAAGGGARLDLLAFATGSRARRYVDSLATTVWLERGDVAAGAGAADGRAGFHATTFGPSARIGNVGRWGRWVASAWADLPLRPGPGPAPRAFDVAGLVESALAAVAARDAARAEPTVRNPWEDPAARKDAYEEAVAAVESVCRTKFRRRPAFQAPTLTELRDILARALRDGSPGASDEEIAAQAAHVAAGVLGIYIPALNALYVVPGNISGQPAGVEVGWLGEVMMRVIFAHELVHALDAERFSLAALERAAAQDDKRGAALWALTEGHAHWAARKAALAWGIPEAFVTARETQGRTPVVATPYLTARSVAAKRNMFGYEEGLAFFEAVEAARGLDGVDAVFARPPRTPEEIARPELWIDPSKARAPGYEDEWRTNPIAQAIPGPAQLAESITLRSGLRVHLAFLDAAEREGALHGFEDGHGFRAVLDGGAVIDATVLRFATVEDAQRFAVVLRRVSEAKDRAWSSGVDRFDDIVYAEGVGSDGKRPGFRVSRTLVAKGERLHMENTTAPVGRSILEMNVVDADAAVLAALHRAYDEYLARLAGAPTDR